MFGTDKPCYIVNLTKITRCKLSCPICMRVHEHDNAWYFIVYSNARCELRCYKTKGKSIVLLKGDVTNFKNNDKQEPSKLVKYR